MNILQKYLSKSKQELFAILFISSLESPIERPNHELLSKRVLNEHVIGKVKRFKFIADK